MKNGKKGQGKVSFGYISVTKNHKWFSDKLKQVNLLESLPYEEPEDVVEEPEVADEFDENIQTELDDDGQITLSLD